MSGIENPLVQAEMRNWRYWREDGIPYLTSGLFGMLFGVMLPVFKQMTAMQGREWVVELLILGWVLSAARINAALKAWLVWPRTGYAQPPYFALLWSRSDDLPELRQFRLRKRLSRLVLVLSLMLIAEWGYRHGLLPPPPPYTFVALAAGVTLYGAARLAWYLHRNRAEGV